MTGSDGTRDVAGRDDSAPAPRTVLDDSFVTGIDRALAAADAALTARVARSTGIAQPVHTVYLPADRYAPGIVREWGRRALSALRDAAPDADSLADAIGLPRDRVRAVWDLLLRKLTTSPIEDLRLDFDNSYGHRDDAIEDADAVRAGRNLAADWEGGAGPAWAGIRLKSLDPTTCRRGIRSLDLFLAALTNRACGLPVGLRLTLPRVTRVEQVTAMADVCRELERVHRLSPMSLLFEIQVETPQAILGDDGTATVARVARAAQGRCAGLHFDTVGYSAALGISVGLQQTDRSATDYATTVMQLAAAGAGVAVSDGSINILPVGEPDAVRAAWALHAGAVSRSLDRGFHQGWDLHPAQLVTRYVATYDFYRSGAPAAGRRIEAYLAHDSTGVVDNAATGAALADFLLRGMRCGALAPSEVSGLTGASVMQLEALAGRGVG